MIYTRSQGQPSRALHPATRKCQVPGWHSCPVYCMVKSKPVERGTRPPQQRKQPRKEVVAKTNLLFRAWIRSHPCCVLLTKAPPIRGNIEAAHVRSRGAGGVDASNLVPLCRSHHAEQHRIGVKSFEKRYGIDLRARAAAYWSAFCAASGTTPTASYPE